MTGRRTRTGRLQRWKVGEFEDGFPGTGGRTFKNRSSRRFSKLYERSLAAHHAHSHLSIEYRPFCRDFDAWCPRMFDVAGCTADPALFKHFIVQPENQRRHAIQPSGIGVNAANLVDRFGRKYAKARVRLEDHWRAPRP